MRKQLDKNLSFHKLVAYMIALMTGELKGDLSHLRWDKQHEHKAITRVEYFQKISLKPADSHALKKKSRLFAMFFIILSSCPS